MPFDEDTLGRGRLAQFMAGMGIALVAAPGLIVLAIDALTGASLW